MQVSCQILNFPAHPKHHRFCSDDLRGGRLQDQAVGHGARLLAVHPQPVPEPVLEVRLHPRHARLPQVRLLPDPLRHRRPAHAGGARTGRRERRRAQEALLESHHSSLLSAFFNPQNSSNPVPASQGAYLSKYIYIASCCAKAPH